MQALSMPSTPGFQAASHRRECYNSRRMITIRQQRSTSAQSRLDRSAVVRANASNSEPSTGLQPELAEALDKFVVENKIVVFMKGDKENPLCGFSRTVCQILSSLNAPFVTVNILEDEQLRSGVKEWSNWPTFPQLYIGGEFFGGCDITIQAFQSGELQQALEAALDP